MRILIGYDGSEYSDAIFNDLRRAGLPRDPEVKVVSVADLLSGPPAVEMAAEIIPSRRVVSALEVTAIHADRVKKEAEGLARKAADRFRAEFPEWQVTSEVVTGTPGWELLDAAKEWNADLIVVGSHGRSAVGRLLLGSVSKRVANDAECSVRVVRPSASEDKDAPPRILVGIDGSPAAGEAVNEVGRRVWPAGTLVHLVVARDIPSLAGIATLLPQAAAMIGELEEGRKDRAEQMLEWATDQLSSIGLNVATTIQKGDPKRILLEAAGSLKADSIFVGTRNFKNAFERFRLGSVSSGVVNDAGITVEVVRGVGDENGETDAELNQGN